jgi:O-antigen biosynthesis protein
LDREHTRRELGVGADELCVLLLGTVCERKGQKDLVRAFANLPAPIASRMRCIVVGARDSLAYSRNLKVMAAGLPNDRRDRFVIIAETGETTAYWRAADVFCCTSRVESYPRVILEAMAAGLPIITTPVFGIAEQVRDSINGLHYQPGDVGTLGRHLALLASDEGKRRSLAAASSWVLRSLPGHAEMDYQYLRAFRAAAESACFSPIDDSEPIHPHQDPTPRRTWLIGVAREAIAPRKTGLNVETGRRRAEKV